MDCEKEMGYQDDTSRGHQMKRISLKRNRVLFSGVIISLIGTLLVLTYSNLFMPEINAAPSKLLTPTPQTQYLPLIMQHSSTPVPPKPTGGGASWSSPIAVSTVNEMVWAVNPDAGSITVIDGERLEKITEITVGQEPWNLVISPDGQWVYVTDRALGALIVIDAQNRAVIKTLSIGPEVNGIALSPTGETAFIAVSSDAEVVILNLRTYEITERIAVDPQPYAIAVTNDGDSRDDDEHVFVTHFQAFPQPDGIEATDNGRVGRVTVLETASQTISHQIILSPDSHGFPNLLAGLTIHENQAWIPHVRAAPDLPNNLTTTVFAAVVVLDLDLMAEAPAKRLLLNDQDIFGSPVNDPLAAIPAPDGQHLYVILAGSDLVEVVDIANPNQPQLTKFLPTGKNPRGLALNPDGRRGYVLNYLSRSITVLDLENLMVMTEIPVTDETLAPDIWRGKVLFNNAVNPKLSQGSWISCASCHPDGGSDGVTWMFPDGPRQTPPLWNTGQTGPWHWSAALDEPQDVEETVQIIQHGLGLAPGIDPPQLGAPNAARSADLDAMAAFITQGIRVPNLPSPTADYAAGRALFQSADCAVCHGGPTWTSSTMPGAAGTLDPDSNGMVDVVLRQVGTLNPRDIRGDTGFDPPSLLDVGLTAPYFHDGSMPSLEALLTSGHPDPQGAGNGLNSEEAIILANFLRTIGLDTPSVDEAP